MFHNLYSSSKILLLLEQKKMIHKNSFKDGPVGRAEGDGEVVAQSRARETSVGKSRTKSQIGKSTIRSIGHRNRVRFTGRGSAEGRRPFKQVTHEVVLLYS